MLCLLGDTTIGGDWDGKRNVGVGGLSKFNP